jgi:hypothetical protein
MNKFTTFVHSLRHGELEPGATPQPDFTSGTDAGDQLDRTRPSTPNPAAGGVPAAEDQIAQLLQLVDSTNVVDEGSANLFTTLIMSNGEFYETNILSQRTARHQIAQNNVAESDARLEAARRRHALAVTAHDRATTEELSISRSLKGDWDTTTVNTSNPDNKEN